MIILASNRSHSLAGMRSKYPKLESSSKSHISTEFSCLVRKIFAERSFGGFAGSDPAGPPAEPAAPGVDIMKLMKDYDSWVFEVPVKAAVIFAVMFVSDDINLKLNVGETFSYRMNSMQNLMRHFKTF
jgi:hypothetical protein